MINNFSLPSETEIACQSSYRTGISSLLLETNRKKCISMKVNAITIRGRNIVFVVVVAWLAVINHMHLLEYHVTYIKAMLKTLMKAMVTSQFNYRSFSGCCMVAAWQTIKKIWEWALRITYKLFMRSFCEDSLFVVQLFATCSIFIVH